MRDLDKGWNGALKAAAKIVREVKTMGQGEAHGFLLDAIAVDILTLVRNEAEPAPLFRQCFQRMVIQVPSHQSPRAEGRSFPPVVPDVLLLYDTKGITLHEDKPWWRFPKAVKVGQGGIMRIKVSAPRLVTEGELYIGTTKER